MLEKKRGGEKMKLNPHKTGLVLGATIGLFHLVWATLVLLGFAQTLLGFVLSLHFLSNPYQVMTFDLVTALLLVAVTTGVGYLVGKIFALVWNYIQK